MTAFENILSISSVYDPQLVAGLFVFLVLYYLLYFCGQFIITCLKFPFRVILYTSTAVFIFVSYLNFVAPYLHPTIQFLYQLTLTICTSSIHLPILVIDQLPSSEFTTLSATSVLCVICGLIVLLTFGVRIRLTGPVRRTPQQATTSTPTINVTSEAQLESIIAKILSQHTHSTFVTSPPSSSPNFNALLPNIEKIITSHVQASLHPVISALTTLQSTVNALPSSQAIAYAFEDFTDKIEAIYENPPVCNCTQCPLPSLKLSL